ncbi:hypothetical protein APHAL10511_006617, partial [Amanita phalloides]
MPAITDQREFYKSHHECLADEEEDDSAKDLSADEDVAAVSKKVDVEDALEDIEEVEDSDDQNRPERSGEIAFALDNLGLETSGDIEMVSPPQGSSRVTGGVLRGRAIGNVLNLPDADDILEPPILAKGTIRLFSDLSHKPSHHKPTFTFNTEAEPTLAPILEKLGRNYSP